MEKAKNFQAKERILTITRKINEIQNLYLTGKSGISADKVLAHNIKEIYDNILGLTYNVKNPIIMLKIKDAAKLYDNILSNLINSGEDNYNVYYQELLPLLNELVDIYNII